VFLPVAAYPGFTGIICRQLALTVAFAILISTFNARTFSPMVGDLILKGRPPGTEVAPKGSIWPVLGDLVALAAAHFIGGGLWFAVWAVVGALVGSQLTRSSIASTRPLLNWSRVTAVSWCGLVQWRRWVLVALAAGLVVTVMGFRASPQDFIPNTD